MSKGKRYHNGKVVFEEEIEAKIALAPRVWKDKGEVRHYECYDSFGNKHWHLTSQAERIAS